MPLLHRQPKHSTAMAILAERIGGIARRTPPEPQQRTMDEQTRFAPVARNRFHDEAPPRPATAHARVRWQALQGGVRNASCDSA